MNHWPNQDQADEFLIKINQCITQTAETDKAYPVIQYSTPDTIILAC